MIRYTVDTGVFSLYFARDERIKPYFDEIADHGGGYVSSVNLAEFFNLTCRSLGKEVALHRYHQLGELFDTVPADEELSMKAGLFKCRSPGLSLADCYAAAVATMTDSQLLTTDGTLARSRLVKTRHFAIPEK